MKDVPSPPPLLHTQSYSPVLRTLQVLLAPHLPLTSVQYYIDSDSLHGVEETPCS